eukprot:13480133-Alexandrium_andersonii.AAC.1
MRALGDASLIRISYSASVYHTPSNARPVRAVESSTYPSHSSQKQLAVPTRAVEPIYDVTEVFRTVAQPE